MPLQAQIRRATSTEWVAENPILGAGEVGVDLDRSWFKLGDGSTSWNDLPYAVALTASLANTASHNSLTGLQGGTAGQYYHLTAAELAAVQGGGSGLATGSLYQITSSWAISASYAPFTGQAGTTLTTGSTYPITSSWSVNSRTASLASNSILFNGTASNQFASASHTHTGYQPTLTTGSSYPITSSWAVWAINATAAQSATSATTANFATSATSCITADTASLAILARTASLAPDYQKLIGTGSTLPITSSWATNWNSSSVITLIGTKQNTIATGSLLPITSSWAVNWNSSSIVSLIGTKQNTLGTGSTYPFTSSWATNVVNDQNTWLVTGSTYPITSSWAVNWNSSSVITLIGTKQNTIATGSLLPVTSSWAVNWNSASVITLIGTKQNTIATGSTLPITSSWATTAVTANTASRVGVSTTADNDLHYPTFTTEANGTMQLRTDTDFIYQPFLNRLTVGNITSSLYGTASWATNAVNATPSFTGKFDNYLPKWSTNELTATSLIYDDGTEIGIGTTSPSFGRLCIQQPTNNSVGGIGILGSGLSTARIFLTGSNNLIINRGGTVDAMAITTTGLIGIGTTAPQTTLHLYQSTGNPLILEGGSDTAFIGYYPQGYAAGRKGWMGFGSAVNTKNIYLANDNVDGTIGFYQNSAIGLALTGSKVGIGVSTPSHTLTVNGSTYFANGNGNNYIPFTDGNVYLSAPAMYFRNSSNVYKVLFDTNNERFNFTGSVGVSGNVTATSFLGTATNANNVNTTNNADSGAYYIPFFAGATGYRPVLTNASVRFDPAQGELTATKVVATAINTTNITASAEYISSKIAIGTPVIPTTYACSISASAGGTGSLMLRGDFQYVAAKLPATRALATLDDYMLPIVTSGSAGVQTYYIQLYRK